VLSVNVRKRKIVSDVDSRDKVTVGYMMNVTSIMKVETSERIRMKVK